MQWEYKYEKREELSENALNEFGDEGWELVAAFFEPDGGRAYATLVSSIFKRPKPTTIQETPILTDDQIAEIIRLNSAIDADDHLCCEDVYRLEDMLPALVRYVRKDYIASAERDIHWGRSGEAKWDTPPTEYRLLLAVAEAADGFTSCTNEELEQMNSWHNKLYAALAAWRASRDGVGAAEGAGKETK